MSLFNTNPYKDYSKPKRVKNVYGGRKKPRKLEIIKNVKNLFRLKRKIDAIKDRVIRDSRKLFEQEENYYKPVRVDRFWNSNYIERENNGDREKTYQLNNTSNGIRYNLQLSNKWKIHLTTAINFFSSKDIDEEPILPSKLDNMEIISQGKSR